MSSTAQAAPLSATVSETAVNITAPSTGPGGHCAGKQASTAPFTGQNPLPQFVYKPILFIIVYINK